MAEHWLALALAAFGIGALARVCARLIDQLDAERKLIANLVATVQTPGTMAVAVEDGSVPGKLFVSEDDELRADEREAIASVIERELHTRIGVRDVEDP